MRISPLIVILLLVGLPAKAADYQAVGASYRFLGLPDFTISSTFEAHQPVLLHGATLHYSRGNWKGHWGLSLAFGGTTIADGFWQAAKAEASSAVWVEYEIGFVGAVATYTWRLPIWRDLFFAPTLGVGLAAVLGDIYATEVLPGCEGDVNKCGHWRNVTRHPVDLSNRIMPILQASGQFGYRITEEFMVGLDFGLLNVPFTGITAEYAL